MHVEENDLEQCETFLRAIGKEASEIWWSECQRHEWHAYEWDVENEEIRLGNPHNLKVVDLSLKD